VPGQQPIAQVVQLLEMLYLFDVDEALIAVLPQDSFFTPRHYEGLNRANTFTFSYPADREEAQYIIEGNLVGYKDLDVSWHIFEIKRIVDLHGDGLTRTAYCEHIYYELRDDLVADQRPAGSAISALSGVLAGTRWQVGIVDDLGASSTTIYYESALSGVQKIAEAWQGELQWRCFMIGGTIVRYCDLLAMRGTDTGKQFAYSKDIISIEREVDTSGVVTALYGRGKGVETDAGTGYGRRLTFADVVWTVAGGDPVDKPAGQEWVGDPGALAQFGRPGGRHRFGVFTNEDETDPALLLQETWDSLQDRKTPRVTYRLKVAALETLTGYSHEAVRLGDLVRVIDREFKPELLVSARVVELTRDLQDPSNTEAVLGSFAPTIVEANINVERQVNDLANKPFNTAWLDGVINVLQNEINNTQSYVFQTPGDGILIMDAATFALSTKAMKIGGGIFALANTKTGDQWNWRAFGDGAGFTADEINAGKIKAEFVQIGSASTFSTGYDPSGKLSAGMGVDSDCTALFHFDGSLNSHKGLTPAFTRASVAYLSDGTQVAAGVPRFEAGKFGKGVLVEEGTTNLLTANQSNIETSLDAGYTANGGAIVRNTAEHYEGIACVEVVCSTAINSGCQLHNGSPSVCWSTTPGLPYTASFRIKGYAGVERLVLVLLDNLGAWLTYEVITLTKQWQRRTLTGVPSAGSTGVSIIMYKEGGTDANQYRWWLDTIQIEQKAYATSWQIGGTARAAEILSIPTAGIFVKGNWTVSMVFTPKDLHGDWYRLWDLVIDGDNYYTLVYWPNDIKVFFEMKSGGTQSSIAFSPMMTLDTPHKITITGNGTTAHMIVDGVEIGAGTAYTEPAGNLPVNMYLGCNQGGAGQANGIIDELRIDKIAHTAEEAASWYKANSPFYSSEDVAQLPGYLRAETDGYKVYDSAGALRVLLGSWLRDAIRKYGVKIIDGEIYSSLFRTNAEGATSYISLEDNELKVYEAGLLTMKMTCQEGGHGYLYLYEGGVNTLIVSGHDANPGIRAKQGYKLDLTTLASNASIVLNTDGSIDIDPTATDNTCTIFGNFAVTGSGKGCIVETKDYGPRWLYAVEAPDIRLEQKGSAQLVDGSCRVDLNPIFLQTIEPDLESAPWVIDITPYFDAKLYISEINSVEGWFIVKECGGGLSAGRVAWSLSAVKIGCIDLYIPEFKPEGDVLTSGWEDEYIDVIR